MFEVGGTSRLIHGLQEPFFTMATPFFTVRRQPNFLVKLSATRTVEDEIAAARRSEIEPGGSTRFTLARERDCPALAGQWGAAPAAHPRLAKPFFTIAHKSNSSPRAQRVLHHGYAVLHGKATAELI